MCIAGTGVDSLHEDIVRFIMPMDDPICSGKVVHTHFYC